MDRRQAAKEILSAVVVLGSQKPTSMVPMRAQGESLALHLRFSTPTGWRLGSSAGQWAYPPPELP